MIETFPYVTHRGAVGTLVLTDETVTWDPGLIDPNTAVTVPWTAVTSVEMHETEAGRSVALRTPLHPFEFTFEGRKGKARVVRFTELFQQVSRPAGLCDGGTGAGSRAGRPSEHDTHSDAEHSAGIDDIPILLPLPRTFG
jgi:hypothetical protein